MKEIMKQRLATLKHEHEAGQKMLADLDTKRQNLVHALLRIEGAIQVLTELEVQREPASDVVIVEQTRNGAPASAPLS